MRLHGRRLVVVIVAAAGAVLLGVAVLVTQGSPRDAAGCEPPRPKEWSRPTPVAQVSPSRSPRPGPPRRIMLIGDSITHGSSGDFTWRYRLHQHLIASGEPVDFVGPYSDLENVTTTAAGDRDDRYADPKFDRDHGARYGRALSVEATTIGASVAQHRPDYLLVLLGANDLAFFKSTPEQVAANLALLVGNARASRPGLRIVLGPILPSLQGALDAELAAKVAETNVRLAAAVALLDTPESGVALAPAGADYRPDVHTWDGTHPNARGELRIAAGFADVLASEFGLGARYPRPFPELPVGPSTAPKLLIESAGPSSARLRWAQTPGTTQYWVWMRDDVFTPRWTRLPAALPAGLSQWRADNLAPGVTYVYRLQAAKGTDLGAVSNEVRLTIPGGDGPDDSC